LDAHLQERSVEAHRLLKELLAPEPKGPGGLPIDYQALWIAEERVREVMFDFHADERENLGPLGEREDRARRPTKLHVVK
jgi:hypothetical protein